MVRLLQLGLLSLLVCLSLGSVGTAAASGEPQPVELSAPAEGPVVLSISTPRGPAQFTLADLERLGMFRVSTQTFWSEDDGTYEGPMLASVLKAAGIDQAGSIEILAIDGFSQTLPSEDWENWPILMATRRDGEPMSLRNKGPIRIIYPRDMDAQLEDPVYRLRWVWMVNQIKPAP